MSGSNPVFNIALGRVVEKIADDATKIGIVLIKTVQADATLRDHDTLAAVLGANTEADFTNYVRKTGVTGTITVDDTNDWVDVDVPDQTWTSAGNSGTAAGSGAGNNILVKLITYYEEAAADATRIPLTAHTFDASTDGNDLIAQIASSGFFRAA